MAKVMPNYFGPKHLRTCRHGALLTGPQCRECIKSYPHRSIISRLWRKVQGQL